MTAHIPKWMLDEIHAWMEQNKAGSLTFHSDGHKFTKIERHEFERVPAEVISMR